MSTLRPREKVKQRNSQNHHFPMKNLHFWKATRRPRVASCLMWPQPGVVSFTTESDATDSDFPSGDPHAGPLGSADSTGLRPLPPTPRETRTQFVMATTAELSRRCTWDCPVGVLRVFSNKDKDVWCVFTWRERLSWARPEVAIANRISGLLLSFCIYFIFVVFSPNIFFKTEQVLQKKEYL